MHHNHTLSGYDAIYLSKVYTKSEIKKPAILSGVSRCKKIRAP